MIKRAAPKAAKPGSGEEEWMWLRGWPHIDWATEYCTEEADPIPDLLLGRYRRDKRGLAKHSYLRGAEEYEARKLLADLLRSRVDVRSFDSAIEVLAALIDPEGFVAREIKFGRRKRVGGESRKKGRDPQVIANYQIIEAVRDLHKAGIAIEDATAEVGERFKLSESRVLKLWSDRRNILREYRRV
jgi:hypothetical protein